MIYPLTERRISGFDRRNDNSQKRKDSQDQVVDASLQSANERRFGQDRRQLKLNREKLLESIITKKSNSKLQQLKSMWQDFIQPILIPLVIGGSSFYVTQQVNDQQIKSADKIAIQNRENSRMIADAGLKTQHLSQMAGIFSEIINLINQPSDKKKTQEDTLKQRIMSLSVYGDEALPFLLQLRDEYRDENYYAKSEETISDTADNTIEKILKLNQHQIKVEFVSDSGELLNLPRRKYINYNLSDSTFKDVNLYEADFSHSSLQESKFKDVDLRKTNFSNTSLIKATFENSGKGQTQLKIFETRFDHANLEGAKFINVDLTNVNFEKAHIMGVNFDQCKSIEKAKFSMNQLLQADTEPFKSVSTDKYLSLLMKYEERLAEIHEKNAQHLKQVYSKLKLPNLNDIDELRTKFSNFKESIAQNNSNQIQPFLAKLWVD
ncbi:MAG: pentapeptide repeat-containing protein [Methylococcales bacterium]